jgi:hypothetical protein
MAIQHLAAITQCDYSSVANSSERRLFAKLDDHGFDSAPRTDRRDICGPDKVARSILLAMYADIGRVRTVLRK